MASTDARAATATWLTPSERRNASGSCSPATSLNSRRFRLGRSCRFWRIVACTSAQSAAFTEFSMPTVRFTGGVVHGHHRNQDQCHG